MLTVISLQYWYVAGSKDASFHPVVFAKFPDATVVHALPSSEPWIS
jgi:hypothetical protein